MLPPWGPRACTHTWCLIVRLGYMLSGVPVKPVWSESGISALTFRNTVLLLDSNVYQSTSEFTHAVPSKSQVGSRIRCRRSLRMWCPFTIFLRRILIRQLTSVVAYGVDVNNSRRAKRRAFDAQVNTVPRQKPQQRYITGHSGSRVIRKCFQKCTMSSNGAERTAR